MKGYFYSGGGRKMGRIGAAGKPVLCRGAYSRSAAFRYLVGNSGYCKQAG